MTLHPLREQFFRLNDFKTTARRREDKERKLTRKENVKRKTTKSVTDIKGSSSRRRDCFDTFQLPLLFPITTHPSLLLFPNQLAILSSFVSSLFFFDVFSIWLFSEKFQAIGCNDEKERERNQRLMQIQLKNKLATWFWFHARSEFSLLCFIFFFSLFFQTALASWSFFFTEGWSRTRGKERRKLLKTHLTDLSPWFFLSKKETTTGMKNNLRKKKSEKREII